MRFVAEGRGRLSELIVVTENGDEDDHRQVLPSVWDIH